MDYPELVIECALRSGMPEFPARAPYYLKQAERDLEKVLAVAEMEAEATLTTDADGIAPLPADFARLRSVQGNGSIAVKGNEAWTGVPSGTVQIYYYARLPGLQANGTNWLLEQDPEIYVQALLAQAYTSMGDQRAAVAGQLLQGRLAALQRADKVARYSGQIIDTRGQM